MTELRDAAGTLSAASITLLNPLYSTDRTTDSVELLTCIAKIISSYGGRWWAPRPVGFGCGAAAPPNGGDREWFGVWDRPPSFNTADGQCTRWLSDITQVAGTIRQAMVSADEAARVASVYPGVRRDLRHKYKLDWDGW